MGYLEQANWWLQDINETEQKRQIIENKNTSKKEQYV